MAFTIGVTIDRHHDETMLLGIIGLPPGAEDPNRTTGDIQK
jgi:hypothetical protein